MKERLKNGCLFVQEGGFTVIAGIEKGPYVMVRGAFDLENTEYREDKLKDMLSGRLAVKDREGVLGEMPVSVVDELKAYFGEERQERVRERI